MHEIFVINFLFAYYLNFIDVNNFEMLSAIMTTHRLKEEAEDLYNVSFGI